MNDKPETIMLKVKLTRRSILDHITLLDSCLEVLDKIEKNHEPIPLNTFCSSSLKWEPGCFHKIQ